MIAYTIVYIVLGFFTCIVVMELTGIGTRRPNGFSERCLLFLASMFWPMTLGTILLVTFLELIQL